MISLTSDPDQVFMVMCQRGERVLMLRNDDPDRREVILWVTPTPAMPSTLAVAREWMIEASVALDRESVSTLASTLFEVAEGMDDPGSAQFATNGSGP